MGLRIRCRRATKISSGAKTFSMVATICSTPAIKTSSDVNIFSVPDIIYSGLAKSFSIRAQTNIRGDEINSGGTRNISVLDY